MDDNILNTPPCRLKDTYFMTREKDCLVHKLIKSILYYKLFCMLSNNAI